MPAQKEFIEKIQNYSTEELAEALKKTKLLRTEQNILVLGNKQTGNKQTLFYLISPFSFFF